MRPIPTRAASLLAISLLLSGCSSSLVASYGLSFDTTDIQIVGETTDAAFRVIERRLDRLGVPLENQSVVKTATGTVVTFDIPSKELHDQLTAELTAPFDLAIMTESTDPEPDLILEDVGGFDATGVTENDIYFVQSRPMTNSNQAEVQIRFTEEGKAKMQQVLTAAAGKDIGIFVRRKLVARMSIASSAFNGAITIPNIPSPDIAQIFTDDVNVGAHVVFTPLP